MELIVFPTIFRVCSKCSVEQPLEDFPRLPKGKYGRRTYCKRCFYAHFKQYHSKNVERYAELNRRWGQENSGRKADLHRQWVIENRERNKEIKREHYARHVEGQLAKKKLYRIANLPRILALNAKRNAVAAMATPTWSNMKYIRLWYVLAKDEAIRTGRSVHVDHIVPLNHPLVCGLHCEHNLQLLFSVDNLRKSNRYWPDMP